MKKGLILTLVLVYILYSSAEKSNKKKKVLNAESMDKSFVQGGGRISPGDIIESVHSSGSDVPEIKIEFAGYADDNDNADATISIENESEEDEDDDEPKPKKKLPKSKAEDIHTFL